MQRGESLYIWQQRDWPAWHFDLAALAGAMACVSLAQGRLLGRLADVGMALRRQASLAALTQDVVNTSEIEGEHLPVLDRARQRRAAADQGRTRPSLVRAAASL